MLTKKRMHQYIHDLLHELDHLETKVADQDSEIDYLREENKRLIGLLFAVMPRD